MSQENKAAGREHIPDFPSPPPTGVNWLLVIAIDEYVHCPRLYNCVKDAHDLIELLTERYHFERNNFKEIFNAAATRANIYNAFRDLAQRVTPNDNLLIYFSGHGEYDPVLKRGFWIPVDAKPNDHYEYVSNSDIKDFLPAINSHHTFLMADSCFAGALFADKGVNSIIPKRYEKDPSRWGLTAGRNEIVSDGKPGDNSPFAESLLYRLRQNTDALGVAELCAYVTEYVQAKTNQTPIGEPLKVEGHKNGQFVFHLRNFEKDKWEVIRNLPEETEAQINQKILRIDEYVDQNSNAKNVEEAFDLGEYLEYKRDFINAQKSIFSLRKFALRQTPFKEEALQLIENRKKGLTFVEEAKEKEFSTAYRPESTSNISKKDLPNFGTFTDDRDGKTYKTVELNGLVWMAENLNYDLGEKSLCYQNDKLLGKEYGRLYNWDVAMNEACPPGWRLPTDEEWRSLIKPLGGYFDKLINSEGVEVGNDLAKAFFTVKELLQIKDGGGFKDHNFGNFQIASYWSAERTDVGNRINYDFIPETKAIYRTKSGRFNALSVRYVRDPKLDAKLILPKEERITNPPRLSFEPEMVFVQGGTFKMGSNEYDSEKPIHEVTVKDFYIGKYPLTLAEFKPFIESTNFKTDADRLGGSFIYMGSSYKKIMGVNWSYDFEGNKRPEKEYDHPIINVSWNDVIAYCKWLSGQTGKDYRLPSEAEWEYAARGGNQSKSFKYAGSNNLDAVSWYRYNSDRKTHPVGQRKANELGIYDMSGNVSEWCEDVWHNNYDGAPTDGSAWMSGRVQDSRVVRGGSWAVNDYNCRVSSRDSHDANDGIYHIGFRLAGY